MAGIENNMTSGLPLLMQMAQRISPPSLIRAASQERNVNGDRPLGRHDLWEARRGNRHVEANEALRRIITRHRLLLVVCMLLPTLAVIATYKKKAPTFTATARSMSSGTLRG